MSNRTGTYEYQEIQCPMYWMRSEGKEVAVRATWRGGFAWVSAQKGRMLDTETDVLMGQEVPVTVHLIQGNLTKGPRPKEEHSCTPYPVSSFLHRIIRNHEVG